jgi:hypothetical protein
MFRISGWVIQGPFRVRLATSLIFYIQVVGQVGSCGESGLLLFWGWLVCFGFGDGLGLATGFYV